MRDGLYAADLIAAAISHIDFFTWLAANPCVADADICEQFGFVVRPVDVLLTLCRAYGFVLTDAEDRHQVSVTSQEHLVRESPFFLGANYDSMKDRPVTLDYLEVFKTGKPANWASLEDQDDWYEAMHDEHLAQGFTAAMDCRGLALGQALARSVGPFIGGRQQVLDVGGGSDIYTATLLAAYPELRGVVIEQAPVDAIAKKI